MVEDGYISRHAAVKAGMPIETPALTVNRICGSGLEAINTAARYIQCGDATVVVAGGAENMTMMPYYLRNAAPATAWATAPSRTASRTC